MTQRSGRYIRQWTLPGWGSRTQEKLEMTALRVRGKGQAARACAEYLSRAGSALEGKAELEVLFEEGEPSAARAVLGRGRHLAFWSKVEGACLRCLEKRMEPRGPDGGILMGALAADGVLTYLAGLSEWKPGRLIGIEDGWMTKEERVGPTPGCPDCCGTPSLPSP